MMHSYSEHITGSKAQQLMELDSACQGVKRTPRGYAYHDGIDALLSFASQNDELFLAPQYTRYPG
jgi:hypothetical protein